MEPPSTIVPSMLTSPLHVLMPVELVELAELAELEVTKSAAKRTETREARRVIHYSLRTFHSKLQKILSQRSLRSMVAFLVFACPQISKMGLPKGLDTFNSHPLRKQAKL